MKMFVAPQSLKAESCSHFSLPREKRMQNAPRMFSAKLFAQQTPEQLVTNEEKKKKQNTKEEIL